MELKELLGDAYKDGMTMDEVSEALKEIQMPTDQSAEIDRLKKSLSDSNSEAADWKRKFRETQDENTRKASEAEEATKKMLQELEELRNEKTISGYKASYLGLGYDEKDADEISKALAAGEMTKVLEVQRRHQEALIERTRKDVLKDTPRPGGGGKEDLPEDKNIELAKSLGQASAGAEKTAQDVLKNYFR